MSVYRSCKANKWLRFAVFPYSRSAFRKRRDCQCFGVLFEQRCRNILNIRNYEFLQTFVFPIFSDFSVSQIRVQNTHEFLMFRSTFGAKVPTAPLWCPCGVFLYFPNSPIICLWLPYVYPTDFLWFPYGVPVFFLWGSL